MWLLPVLPRVASFATKTFYRTTVAGASIPRDGPLLLVGNHPNSLLDPLFLAAVARRPVRFLAKAPLFSNQWTSWAVNAVGAIPVYRPSDNPALVKQNEGMFRAAHDALLTGAAIGIFPEGVSHDAPALVPLRTGAARIALGARARLGSAFPIVPVGLVFRNKDEFRSDVHVVIGEPVSWEEIESPETDPAAVKELTARIERALHGVTLNLEKWEDAALVAAAEEIYVAEYENVRDSRSRVDRWREAARVLSAARREGDAGATALAREIRAHDRALSLFGLRPDDLHGDTSFAAAARWSLRRAGLPVWLTFAWVGALLFWPPYRLTDRIVKRSASDGSGRATVKLVVGAGLFMLWIALLAVVAWTLVGWAAGVIALLLLPLLALTTLALLEKSTDAIGDARRFFLLRSRNAALEELRSRQRELAEKLGATREKALARG